MHSDTNSKDYYLQMATVALNKASASARNQIRPDILNYINDVFSPDVPQLLMQNGLMKIKQVLKDAGVNDADHQYLTELYQLGKTMRRDGSFSKPTEVVGYDTVDLQKKAKMMESKDEPDEKSTPSEWEDRLDALDEDPSSIIKAIDSEFTDLEDIHHIYDLDELELSDEILKEDVLEEHITREERIRRKIRLQKSKSKRERTRAMSLKRLSTMPKLTRKARKLAVELIKKKIAKKNLDSLSLQERERLEDMVLRRKDLINRLTRKLVTKVRQIESARVMGSQKADLKEDTELVEMELANDIPEGWNMGTSHVFNRKIDGLRTGGFDDDLVQPRAEVDMGKVGGLNVSMFVHPEKNDRVDLATHDDQGNVHHYVRLISDEKHPGATITKLAVKNQKIESPVKMHQIYSHLLDHGLSLMSDKTQSMGGLKIWRDLAKNNPNVSVMGWDTKYNFPVNTGKFLDHIDGTHQPMDSTAGQEGEKNKHIIDHVRLIAKKNSALNEAQLFTGSTTDTFGRGAYLGKYGQEAIRGDFDGEETDRGSISGPAGSLQVKHISDDHGIGVIYTHDEDGNVHHMIEVHRPMGYDKNTVVEGTMVATKKYGKRAGIDDIYEHLIKNHGMNIQSDTAHSEGGLAVWKKLAAKPGISVHGWDIYNEKPVNTDKLLRDVGDTHVHEDDEFPQKGETMKDYDEKMGKMHNVVLVAHKTIPMRRKAK